MKEKVWILYITVPLCLMIIFICFTLLELSRNPYLITIRMEMDNNTVEAVKIVQNTQGYNPFNISNNNTKTDKCCYPRNCWNYNESCNHNCEYLIYCYGNNTAE